MKNLLFLFLFISILCNAQTSKIDGFWGMKFGSSSSEVKTKMMQKEGCTLIDNFVDHKEALTFSGVEFAGEKPDNITFIFFNDRLVSAIINIKPDYESSIFTLYDDFCSTLKLKYDKPDLITEKYSYPTGDNLNLKIASLKEGNASISQIWRQANNAEKSEFGKSILIGIDKRVYVYIVYVDEELLDQMDTMNKKQNGNDL